MKAREQTQQMLMMQYEINHSNQGLKKHLWITSCDNTLHINSTLQFMECFCIFDFQNTYVEKIKQEFLFPFNL